jgi:hypothetical protein
MSEEIPGFFDGVLTGVGVCRGFSGGFPLASRMFGPREPAFTIVDRDDVGWLIVLEHHLRSRHSQMARSQVMPTAGRCVRVPRLMKTGTPTGGSGAPGFCATSVCPIVLPNAFSGALLVGRRFPVVTQTFGSGRGKTNSPNEKARESGAAPRPGGRASFHQSWTPPVPAYLGIDLVSRHGQMARYQVDASRTINQPTPPGP